MNPLIRIFLVLILSPLIQSERLITTDTGIASAQWTPMGDKIVYTQNHDGTRGLIRIDANGSNPLQLAGGGPNEWPRWSPDGSQVLYIHTRVEYSGTNTLYRRILHVMNADGSQDRPLLDRTHHFLTGEWSPDGSKILVSSDRELFTIHPDGSNLTPLTSGEAVGMQYLWSPDGNQIAYAHRDGVSIWVMNADGSGARRLISRLNLGQITWSPNSLKIAFQYQEVHTSTPGMHIGVVDVDDQDFTLLVYDPSGYGNGLDWSPDGARIVYSKSSDLYVINVDGSQHMNLTSFEGSELIPSWSPDGSKIAYVGGDNRWEIYTLDPNGANLTRITYNEYDEQTFAWSPDGAYLLFDGGTQPYTSLHIVASSGGSPNLLSANLNVGAFAVSPDEQKIAFAQNSLFDRDLYRVNSVGSNLTRLTVHEQVDYFVWSPDGRRLALYLEQKGLYIIDANATEVTDASRSTSQEMLMSFQWLPGGNQLTFVSNGDIYLVDTLSSNITRVTTEGIYSSPAVSPVARMLAFFGTTPSGLALFTYDVDGGSLTRLLHTWGEIPSSVQWSPDGSKIAYATISEEPPFVPGGVTGINAPLPPPPVYSRGYVVNADGSGNTFIDDILYGISWTPDGHWLRIGYSLVRPDGSERIDYDASHPINGHWSPDGTHVVYLVDDGPGLYPSTSIYIARLTL